MWNASETTTFDVRGRRCPELLTYFMETSPVLFLKVHNSDQCYTWEERPDCTFSLSVEPHNHGHCSEPAVHIWRGLSVLRCSKIFLSSSNCCKYELQGGSLTPKHWDLWQQSLFLLLTSSALPAPVSPLSLVPFIKANGSTGKRLWTELQNWQMFPQSTYCPLEC